MCRRRNSGGGGWSCFVRDPKGARCNRRSALPMKSTSADEQQLKGSDSSARLDNKKRGDTENSGAVFGVVLGVLALFLTPLHPSVIGCPSAEGCSADTLAPLGGTGGGMGRRSSTEEGARPFLLVLSAHWRARVCATSAEIFVKTPLRL